MSFASALKPSDHTFVILEHDGGASTLPEPLTKKRLVLDDSDNEDSLMPTQSAVVLVQDTQFPAIPGGFLFSFSLLTPHWRVLNTMRYFYLADLNHPLKLS